MRRTLPQARNAVRVLQLETLPVRTAFQVFLFDQLKAETTDTSKSLSFSATLATLHPAAQLGISPRGLAAFSLLLITKQPERLQRQGHGWYHLGASTSEKMQPAVELAAAQAHCLNLREVLANPPCSPSRQSTMKALRVNCIEPQKKTITVKICKNIYRSKNTVREKH